MRSAFFALAVSAAAALPASAEEVWLTIDQVRPYEIGRPAGQIVVGNPAIADLTVQDKNRVLLYGKAPGLTNMYIFDDEGQVIDNLIVRVRSTTSEMLTMYRGPSRSTYHCAGICEATVMVGDDRTVFGDVNSQIQQKAAQVLSGAAGSSGVAQ